MADDPTMELALGQLNDLYSNGCFGDNALSDEFANTEANMASGEYAMTVNRLGLPAQIEAADPAASADDYGFFLMPLADNQIWNVNPAAPSKFIYTGSEHIDAAKAYFEFLARPENLQFVLDNEPQFVLLNFDGVDRGADRGAAGVRRRPPEPRHGAADRRQLRQPAMDRDGSGHRRHVHRGRDTGRGARGDRRSPSRDGDGRRRSRLGVTL